MLIKINNKNFDVKVIYGNDSYFPKRLLEIKDSPKKLYVIGNEKLLNNFCIAIIGSRNCTEYGSKQAHEIANKLSEIGITIVSGLAKGIDSVSHKSSISNDGKTIAVLANGFNNIYPKENIELFNNIILNNGCVISEYDLNICATSDKFPKRNRIISGISVGTLMVESAKKSGSNITARYTIEQGKKLFCIPNSIDIKQAEGTNQFIRNGAILTRNYIDIIEEYIPNYYKKKIKDENKKEIPKEYKNVYQNIKESPISINELYRKLSFKSISILNQKLYMMELDGYIQKIAGDKYIRRN